MTLEDSSWKMWFHLFNYVYWISKTLNYKFSQKKTMIDVTNPIRLENQSIGHSGSSAEDISMILLTFGFTNWEMRYRLI
jgi:hypothetical protein